MSFSFAHAGIRVSDMDRALAFYEDVFGFKKLFVMGHPKTGEPWIVYVGTDVPGQFLELFFGGEKEIPFAPDIIGVWHLCLRTEDVQAFADRVKAKGYTLWNEPSLGVDGSINCWIEDPDHNKIEVMQYLPDSKQMATMK